MSNVDNKCIFCGGLSDTREHVFSKCFFDKPFPQKMLTVPACKSCNGSFSKDEQYLMYLIDYLKSIEFYKGKFTREVVKRTFIHNDSLEDRMIKSLNVHDNKVEFKIEVNRINNIVIKIAQGLFNYYSGDIIPVNKLKYSWNFSPKLNNGQKDKISNIQFVVLQENNVKYYYSLDKVFFCLSDFFFGMAVKSQ